MADFRLHKTQWTTGPECDYETSTLDLLQLLFCPADFGSLISKLNKAFNLFWKDDRFTYEVAVKDQSPTTLYTALLLRPNSEWALFKS